MEVFFTQLSKNIRSVIALIITIGCLTWIFIHPHENKEAVIGLLGVVNGYYFLQSKDKSDEQKAKIEIEKSKVEETSTN